MMKPILNIVKLDQIPILQQLRWEEALLRADNQNWCLFNTGSPPAIVMGISGNPQVLINQDKLREKPIPLIRRFSGGGTVIIDEDTLFMTLICQSSTIDVLPFPKQLMEWSTKIYQPLFPSHPFALRENDYVIGEHKWGGNAQSIIKGRWLHHSSLLWDYHHERMDYLLLPPKTPLYRNSRSHSDFLCGLSEYWETKNHFTKKLFQQLETLFVVQEKNFHEIEKIRQIPHRQSTSVIEIT